MRISDWSSDVCSSDLVGGFADVARQAEPVLAGHHDIEDDEIDRIGREPRACGIRIARLRDAKDRKSVVQGKSVSVRVDLGGRRSIKKKTQQPSPSHTTPPTDHP